MKCFNFVFESGIFTFYNSIKLETKFKSQSSRLGTTFNKQTIYKRLQQQQICIHSTIYVKLKPRYILEAQTRILDIEDTKHTMFILM